MCFSNLTVEVKIHIRLPNVGRGFHWNIGQPLGNCRPTSRMPLTFPRWMSQNLPTFTFLLNQATIPVLFSQAQTTPYFAVSDHEGLHDTHTIECRVYFNKNYQLQHIPWLYYKEKGMVRIGFLPKSSTSLQKLEINKIENWTERNWPGTLKGALQKILPD